MSETARDDSTSNPQFDAILADYLRHVANGESMDRERFIAEHPDVADALREYCHSTNRVSWTRADSCGFAVSVLTFPVPPGITMGQFAFMPGSAKRHVAVWQLPSGERRQDIGGSIGPTSYAFSPDSRMLAVGCLDGTAQLWDLTNSEMVFHWTEHSAAITHLAFSPDGTEIASSGAISSSIRFLDLTGLRRQLADLGLGW